MKQPLVTIVLLNFNNSKDTIECLNNLLLLNYDNFKVVIIDNCSIDSSFTQIAEHFDYIDVKTNIIEDFNNIEPEADVFLFKTESNGGFGKGNNYGISIAINSLHSEYVILLNNDTIVKDHLINALLSHTIATPNAGIVSAKINYYPDKERIWFNGGKVEFSRGKVVHFNFGELDKNQAANNEVSFISGCLWFIHKDIFKHIGLICDDYFMYFEDVDYCTRVVEAGYSLSVVPECLVYHKVGSTSGGKLSDFSVFWRSRNMNVYATRFAKDFKSKMLSIFFFNLRMIYSILKHRKISLLIPYSKAIFSLRNQGRL